MTYKPLMKGDEMSKEKRHKKKDKSQFDKPIRERIERLSDSIGNPEEDAKEIQNIKDLVQCKTDLEGKKFEWNWNTLISGGIGLLGLAMVIWHERDGVFSSKAISFVPISKWLGR